MKVPVDAASVGHVVRVCLAGLALLSTGCARVDEPGPSRETAVPEAATTTAAAVAESTEPAADAGPTEVDPRAVRAGLDRLGPRDFDPEWALPRPAVVQLGNEARPVVSPLPRSIVVPERATLVDDGAVRFEAPVPDAYRELPDEALELLVLELPFDVLMDQEAIERFKEKSRFERRDTGWRVQRTDDGSRLQVEIDERDAKQLLSRVEAVGAGPSRLESVPLTFPSGARIRLAHGSLVEAGGRSTGGSTQYRASLRCDETGEHVLHEKNGGLPAGRWFDAEVPVPVSEDGCRLVLEAHGPDGAPAPGAVWAVPHVVSPPGAADEAPQPNIVLISLDTLRADHISGFGYERPTTPVIDAELMARGTSFMQATTTFPRTDIAHMSLMTGVYPSAQPVRGRLAPGSPMVMLAEQLQRAGYETAAFAEGGLFGGPYGFWHGFDRFTEFPYESDARGVGVFRDGAAVVEAAGERPFFLTLHTYKAHDPWIFGDAVESHWAESDRWAEGGLDARVREDQRDNFDAYDRTIREADALLGEFLEALEAAGRADDTVVVVVSDHGESFGEHGVLSHGYGFEQEQMHVPVLFRGPGIPEGARIETPVSLVDVAPTVLDLAGAEPLPHGQGMNLSGAFRGRGLPGGRPLFFSWIRPDATGYRLGRRKVAKADGMSVVHDLKQDPLESGRQRRTPLKPALDRVLEQHRVRSERLRTETIEGTVEVAAPEPITERLQKSLEALGYVE